MRVLAAVAVIASTGALPLKTVATVPLPGGASRLDYASVDSQRHRLFIAHLGGGLVIVFDTKTRRVVKTIPAPGAHGVLVVPELGRVFATATDSHELLTIDERTLKVVARAPAGDYPDGIAWDPGSPPRVRLGRNRRRRDGIQRRRQSARDRPARRRGRKRPVRRRLAPRARGRPVAKRPRRDRPAFRARHAPRGATRLPTSHGLLIDAPKRLAFVACDGNAALLTLDLDRLKVIGTATVGGGADVLAFDTSLRRLYVAAESGEVAVFAERGRALTKLGQGFVAPAAHVVAVDSRTHLVYFPLQFGPQLRIMKPTH